MARRTVAFVARKFDRKQYGREYQKKFIDPVRLEKLKAKTPKGNVFGTTMRSIGSGIYVNIPLDAYAHLYKVLPLGASLSLVIRKDGIIELRKNGAY